MAADLKTKLEELSLMLVMTSEGDPVGTTLLLELCDDLATLAQSSPGHERIVGAVQYLKAHKDGGDVLKLLQDFTSSATRYLENAGDVRFSHEHQSSTESTPTKSPQKQTIDERFLAEFIETHTLLLEDFEATLLDSQSNPNGNADLETTVKRYLHNLKGDSGSIGLLGVELVCHTIEDSLVTTPVVDYVPQLLLFKQWVVQCMDSYAKGSPDESAAEKFLEGLARLDAMSVQATPAPSPVVAATKVEIPQGEYTITGEKDILLEFAAEAEEHLNNVESVILDSEGTYGKDAIDTIFRGVHSIKGGSAYFSIEEMTRCSHILENFLSEVREGKRELDQKLTSLLLTYIDLQKNVLLRAKEAASKDGVIRRSPASEQFLNSLDLYEKGGDVSVTTPSTPAAPRVAKDQEGAVGTTPAPVEAEGKGDKLNLKTFVKVDTARLDLLIDSIGEMVIYSSMLIRHCRELLHDNESVMDATHRVEKFSRDLQDIGMSMRLVPVKGLFQKMSRLVWDTSKKLGKDIVFTMEGEDTELDRNLIDKLADPLMHMVRNSLDHGIEPPDEREKKGKPRTGKVKLSASHAGGSIHIKIEDDGRGLNPAKLIAKAVEKGIITDGQKLSDPEAYQLIFAAGFSTAATVTDISGRGVGMDVVRRNVESLRGRIHIESAIDKGSTFTIEIPLTLAIIDGIQVQVGTETFIIPSLSIIEFVRPTASMLSSALDRAETFQFRGKYLPVYRIADLFGIEPRHHVPTDATMVVVDLNHELVALMVDDILGECSTVIKSLGSVFEEGKGIAGCAIMPRGNVALILDVSSLVQVARSEYRRAPQKGDTITVQ